MEPQIVWEERYLVARSAYIEKQKNDAEEHERRMRSYGR
jgi:hypothetical protein